MLQAASHWPRAQPPPPPPVDGDAINEAKAQPHWKKANEILRNVDSALLDWHEHGPPGPAEAERRRQWTTESCTQALGECREALKHYTDSSKPYLYQVQALRLLGRYDEALTKVKLALAKFSGDADLKAEKRLLDTRIAKRRRH